MSELEHVRRVSELETLRNLRPCVDNDLMLRVEDRLENADLPTDTKHPLILFSRHPLTKLIIFDEYAKAGHAGPCYTLMRRRQRFCIVYGIRELALPKECVKFAMQKATPVRQLMADLPACRVTVTNKPFKYCAVDYIGPYFYRQNRSNCKCWSLLFTCLCTRCIHVEIVASLNLNKFLLAFSRFTNLRGAIDTVYSENGLMFRAAAHRLSSLVGSTEFCNSLRKRNINWVKIPPYSPSQGGSWESMVKLFKDACNRVLNQSRRKPSLIKIQTFTSDAVRIVNNRLLTSLSDKPNDLAVITPSSFLGQGLAPNTPLGAFHARGDLRRDFLHNTTLAHKFWLCWMQGYLPILQGRNKWRVTRNNICTGQLVLVGDAENISRGGANRLGRVHRVYPQWRNGKELVCRVAVAVLERLRGWYK